MEQLDQCYAVYGSGGWEGCNIVQDKLQNHGLCSYSRWEPAPPNWRFFFETNLEPSEAMHVLGSYAARYNIRFR
jgi:hypothetical protein